MNRCPQLTIRGMPWSRCTLPAGHEGVCVSEKAKRGEDAMELSMSRNLTLMEAYLVKCLTEQGPMPTRTLKTYYLEGLTSHSISAATLFSALDKLVSVGILRSYWGDRDATGAARYRYYEVVSDAPADTSGGL